MIKATPNLKSFASLFLVLLGINMAVYGNLPSEYQQIQIIYAHGFLFALSLILDFILNKVKKVDETQIAKAFLAFSTFKMIGSLLFLLPWILNKDPYQLPFIVEFFAIYFIYLMAEALIFIRFYLSKL